MSKNLQTILKLTFMAIFSALCYVGCLVQIPMPTGGFVHLGNFICIAAGLLLGGVYGGISGAVGMGIYDITYYGSFLHPGVFRTMILKFLMGFIAGFLYKLFTKKDVKNRVLNIVVASIFLALMIITSVISAIGPINVGTKTVKIHWFIPVVLAIITLGFSLLAIFSNKMNKETNRALVASSFAVILNILGELFLKAFLYYVFSLAGLAKYPSFDAALIYSVAGIPSVILTSGATLVMIGVLYYPLYRATRSIKFLNTNYDTKIEEEE